MSIIKYNNIVLTSNDEILIIIRHLAQSPNVRYFVPFRTGVCTIMYIPAVQVD